jgi:hypothetical protein
MNPEDSREAGRSWNAFRPAAGENRQILLEQQRLEFVSKRLRARTCFGG